jgi:hypothetical protein
MMPLSSYSKSSISPGDNTAGKRHEILVKRLHKRHIKEYVVLRMLFTIHLHPNKCRG